MRLVSKVLRSMWITFAMLSICFGFWTDLLVSKRPLVEALDGLAPIAAALLPWVILGITAYFVLNVTFKSVQWGIDRLNDGPNVRKFQTLAPRAEQCVSQLLPWAEEVNLMPEGEKIANYSLANVEVRQLLIEFRKLGIWQPEFKNVHDRGQVRFLISYFTGMQSLAVHGNLKAARDRSMENREASLVKMGDEIRTSVLNHILSQVASSMGSYEVSVHNLPGVRPMKSRPIVRLALDVATIVTLLVVIVWADLFNLSAGVQAPFYALVAATGFAAALNTLPTQRWELVLTLFAKIATIGAAILSAYQWLLSVDAGTAIEIFGGVWAAMVMIIILASLYTTAEELESGDRG